jgi:hypothetical protein
MVIRFLIIFKYLKLAILSLDFDFFNFFKHQKLMGITEIKYPTPQLVLFGLGGVLLVHSLAVSTISVGFTFGKELPCYEVHCTQAQNLDFPSFNFQLVKTICFKFLFIYLYLFGVVRGHGEENVTPRWGSRGAFEFSSGAPLQVNC